MTVVAGDAGNTESLKYIVTGTKATGGSSAIAVGKVVKLTEATGVWSAAATSSKGPFGVCANVYPVNGDSDAIINVAVGGGEWYVTADGAIKPYARVMISGSTAGEVVTWASATIDTTPAQADVVAARDEFSKVVGIYLGHEGEGKGGTVPTDAADGEIIRILLGGGAA